MEKVVLEKEPNQKDLKASDKYKDKSFKAQTAPQQPKPQETTLNQSKKTKLSAFKFKD